MAPKFSDGSPGPIRRDWLPEPITPAGDPAWNVKLERILTAADPGLRKLRAQGSGVEASWADLLASWLTPTAALVTAAAVVLLILGSPDAVESERGLLPLSLVATDGDPSALWEGLGIDADPVLALIALQDPPR